MTELEGPLEGFHNYIVDTFAPEDDALTSAREESKRAGLPEISISPSQGKLLHILARLAGARRILEVGTLGGYSAIWLARSLPIDGSMISLELDPHHADVARRNIERAGLSPQVEVRVGAAADSLQKMREAGEEVFDVIFIDADKDGYPKYLELCLPLLREGGLLLGDNTLPDAVLDASADSGTKRYNTTVAANSELTSVIVPALRSRGVDGLTISIKSGA